MRSPIAKFLTPGQLLLTSIGWTASSWGSWLGAIVLATWLLPHTEWLKDTALLGGFALVQALVWMKAVPRSWRAAQAATGSAWVLPACGWLLLLVGAHLYFLGLFLLGLAFALGDPLQF